MSTTIRVSQDLVANGAVQPPARGPLIAELMKGDFVSIGPEQSVAELEELLARHAISGVPVAEDGFLLGVATQTDLVQYHLGRRVARRQDDFHQGLGYDRSLPRGFPATATRVWEIMTPYVFSVAENSTIPEVLELMTRNHIHRVLVTRGRYLVGVVTTMDLLSRYHRELTSELTDPALPCEEDER